MPKCLICKSRFEPFISFGKMPVANGFLTEEQFGEEVSIHEFCQAIQTSAVLKLVTVSV